MNKLLKILMGGVFLIIVTPCWAIMSGNPADVMQLDTEHSDGEISLETNVIFESDISPDNSDNEQTEKGEWYLVKGTINVNDAVDFYVRLGVSHLEHEDSTADIKEKLDWEFAFGGGAMIKLYEYAPWDLKVILDSQYYATLPDIDSVKIGSDSYTGGIDASYEEHNFQTTLLTRIKAGIIYPYAGVTFAYRNISNKFTINNTEYNLSGDNEDKVGLTAGFDFPFNWEEVATGTGILSVEGRFFDELSLCVALTNRF
jgi:hypothetical protein